MESSQVGPMVYCGAGRMSVDDVKYVLHTTSPKPKVFRKESLLLLAMRSLVAGNLWIVLGWRQVTEVTKE